MHFDFGGIAASSLLGALACPLLLVAGVMTRWLPWPALVARMQTINPWRES
jgi:hypothetical protein